MSAALMLYHKGKCLLHGQNDAPVPATALAPPGYFLFIDRKGTAC